jgi:hypothetical protein
VDRPSLDKCLQHRYVDVFLSLVPVEYPIQTLNLHFSTALLQQNIVVRLVWVDQIGTEVDYFTSTVGQTSYTFSSFASHSWRIYLNDKLTKEIEPDATIQIPTLKMTQHLHRILGTERFPGVLNYYTTTDFDIDVPLPPCSGGNGRSEDNQKRVFPLQTTPTMSPTAWTTPCLSSWKRRRRPRGPRRH